MIKIRSRSFFKRETTLNPLVILFSVVTEVLNPRNLRKAVLVAPNFIHLETTCVHGVSVYIWRLTSVYFQIVTCFTGHLWNAERCFVQGASRMETFV